MTLHIEAGMYTMCLESIFETAVVRQLISTGLSMTKTMTSLMDTHLFVFNNLCTHYHDVEGMLEKVFIKISKLQLW